MVVWKEGREGKERLMSTTVKQENWSWRMLPRDQRKVTAPQRLKQPMK
jgi:hypothetical protein